MTATDAGADAEWGALAESDESQRTAAVNARYVEIAALSEEERQSRLRTMMVAEYALDDAGLRAMTLARLRALLAMDMDSAQTVVASLDTVMNTLPGSAAMRRVALVQTLAHEFTPEEQHELRERMPTVFGDRPRVVASASGASTATAASATPPPVKAAKPWWAFWKK